MREKGRKGVREGDNLYTERVSKGGREEKRD